MVAAGAKPDAERQPVGPSDNLAGGNPRLGVRGPNRFPNRREPRLTRQHQAKGEIGPIFQYVQERWLSGRKRRFAKPVREKSLRRFESCPLRSKTLVLPGFLHFLPIALAFLHVHARAGLHMLRRLVRCLGTW